MDDRKVASPMADALMGKVLSGIRILPDGSRIAFDSPDGTTVRAYAHGD